MDTPKAVLFRPVLNDKGRQMYRLPEDGEWYFEFGRFRQYSVEGLIDRNLNYCVPIYTRHEIPDPGPALVAADALAEAADGMEHSLSFKQYVKATNREEYIESLVSPALAVLATARRAYQSTAASTIPAPQEPTPCR